MKSKAPKTAAEVRRANRGNVPGVLGMAELAMLTSKPVPQFKPSDFARLGHPSCSRWGKTEIESLALAYVQAMEKNSDCWDKLSRQEVISLLTPEGQGFAAFMLADDYYQRWFDMVSNQICDSDGALGVGGFWNIHRLSQLEQAHVPGGKP